MHTGTVVVAPLRSSTSQKKTSQNVRLLYYIGISGEHFGLKSVWGFVCVEIRVRSNKEGQEEKKGCWWQKKHLKKTSPREGLCEQVNIHSSLGKGPLALVKPQPPRYAGRLCTVFS